MEAEDTPAATNTTMNTVLDETKYLKLDEVHRLTRFCDRTWSRKHADMQPYREVLVIELGLYAGLRVNEMRQLVVSDLQVTGNMQSLVVRNGKGAKRRIVRIPTEFKKRCQQYLKHKARFEEPTGSEDPVFYSPQTRQPLARRSLQRMFKRVMERLGLPHNLSIHALRHTYGTLLCRSAKYNLRLVQRQLGHSSIRSTEVYLHVEDKILDEAVERLSKLIAPLGTPKEKLK